MGLYEAAARHALARVRPGGDELAASEERIRRSGAARPEAMVSVLIPGFAGIG
jgi:hypothetical protein